MYEEGQTVRCEHCERECIIVRGKRIDSITKKIHTCEQYIKKVKTGLIKPKKKLSEYESFRYSPIKLRRWCTWCGAVWWWNELLPLDMQQIHCPQCEDRNGLPNPKYSHPKYGNQAMVKWAQSQGKEIPKHLKRYS